MIDRDTKVRDLPGLQDFVKYFNYNDTKEWLEVDCSLNELYGRFHDMEPEALCLGLETVLRNLEKGEVIHQVYSETGEKKEDVVLFSFPTEEPSDKPFVIVCAGGAYLNVVNAKEGFPVCARLAQLGYPSFTLNYRVCMDNEIDHALSDLSAGIKYVLSHKQELGVKSDEYILIGGSAGAHLITQFCVKDVGYGKAGLHAPKAIVPEYLPVMNFDPEKEKEPFADNIYGSSYTVEKVKQYDILSHVDADFPPTFLVHAINDELVPYQNSVDMVETLDKAGVKNVLITSPDGGHGFAYGNGTGAEGWVDKAADFFETIK